MRSSGPQPGELKLALDGLGPEKVELKSSASSAFGSDFESLWGLEKVWQKCAGRRVWDKKDTFRPKLRTRSV